METAYINFYKGVIQSILEYAEGCKENNEPMNAEMITEALTIVLDDEEKKAKRFEKVFQKYAPETYEFYKATTK